MRMSHQEFEQHVLSAYEQLPQEARAAVDEGNIDIVVEDWPGPESEGAFDLEAGDASPQSLYVGTPLVDRHGSESSLLGLYVGIPLIDRYGGEPALPDCIYIYRRPILEVCDSYDAVVEEIRVTLLHEIGHYLGLGESDLERLGYG